MKELLKNMIYTGVGAAFLTREKLEEMRKDLVEKGNMTKEEGREFIDELLKKSDSAKDHLEEWLNRNVKERIKKCNFASADEVAELRREVEKLRSALNKEKNSQQDGDDE